MRAKGNSYSLARIANHLDIPTHFDSPGPLSLDPHVSAAAMRAEHRVVVWLDRMQALSAAVVNGRNAPLADPLAHLAPRKPHAKAEAQR